MKALITTMVLCASLGVNAAQTGTKASGTPKIKAKTSQAAGRVECALKSGFCVTVPASWQRLGDVFDDLGFVAAEPQPETDSSKWPQLTVAAMDVPPVKDTGDGSQRPSLDALVETLLTPGGSFDSVQTLERSRLVLNGANAEIVRVTLHDDESQSGAVEEIALIEGEDGRVYSIALHCSAQDFSRLEPVFQKAAHSWRINEAVFSDTPSSQPKQDPAKK